MNKGNNPVPAVYVNKINCQVSNEGARISFAEVIPSEENDGEFTVNWVFACFITEQTLPSIRDMFVNVCEQFALNEQQMTN